MVLLNILSYRVLFNLARNYLGMGDLSLIEWAVYGLIAYSSMLMLIISTQRTMPARSSSSAEIIRAVYLLPGMICAGVLAATGVNITLDTTDTFNTITDLNTTEVWTEETLKTSTFVLVNPVWIFVHIMIFLVILAYVIQQMMILLTKRD